MRTIAATRRTRFRASALVRITSLSAGFVCPQRESHDNVDVSRQERNIRLGVAAEGGCQRLGAEGRGGCGVHFAG